MNKLYLGADPGLNGAIGIVHADGTFHSCEDMPTVRRGSGRVRQSIGETL